MKLLQIHAIEFSYKPTKKALKKHADKSPSEYHVENALLVLTCIERGDNDDVLNQAVSGIRDHAETLRVKKVVLYPYAHLSNTLASPEEAVRMLEKMKNMLEEMGYEVHKAPFGWYKEFVLHAAGHPLSELSREYTTRRTFLAEFDRQFHEQVFRDYAPRFGLTIENNVVKFNEEWITMQEALTRKIGVHGGSEEHLQEVPSAPPEIIVRFPARILPSNITFIETGVPTTKEKALELIEECTRGMLRVDGNDIIVTVPQAKVIIGKTDGETYSIFLNALLLSTIIVELARLQAGEKPCLPAWLHPVQAYIATTKEADPSYVEEVKNVLSSSGLRVLVDQRNVRLGEKLRTAGTHWVPITIIIGKRESDTKTVVVIERETGIQRMVGIKELADYIKERITRQ